MKIFELFPFKKLQKNFKISFFGISNLPFFHRITSQQWIFFKCIIVFILVSVIDSKVYSYIKQFIALLEPEERYIKFQQDGARPHTSNQTVEFLQSFFDDRLISMSLWPPRRPDLMPLDFFSLRYTQKQCSRTPT